MRFLFGICVGAGLTLLIATAIDAPTHPIVEQSRAAWDGLIEVTSRSLFQASAAHAEPGSPAPATAPPAATTRAGAASPTASADDESESADEGATDDDAGSVGPAPTESPSALPTANEPAAAASGDALVLAADRELDRLGRRQVRTRDPDTVPQPDLDPTPATPGGIPAPDPASAGDDAMPPEESILAENDSSERERVWTPFHSERSARGFARRLTDELDHPFTVERRGPGEYQVVFGYADPAERDALLAEIAVVTGR